MAGICAIARLPRRRVGPLPVPDPLRGPTWRTVAGIRSHAALSAIEGSGPEACPWPLAGRLASAARLWHLAHRSALVELHNGDAGHLDGQEE